MQDFGGAKLILFIGDRIVVLRRDQKPDIPWPGRLDLPGGGRERDETAEACVLRETREEVGLYLEPSALIWRQQLNRGVFFAAHLPAHSEEQIVLGGEGQGWLLMEPNTYVSHPEAIPHFAEMVKAYRDQAFG